MSSNVEMIGAQKTQPERSGTQSGRRPSTGNGRAPSQRFAADWLVPTGLILLSLVPAVGGSFRLVELGLGIETSMPDSERIASAPIPIVIHIISVVIYSILGAFQFASRKRRRFFWQRAGWHRTMGKILIPSGFVVALSGLWMTQFSPLPWYDIGPLYWVRMVVGFGMLFSLILATVAIRRLDFAQHGAWMTRAYALALGAGTQVFTAIPWFLYPSIQSEVSRAIMMGAAWLINILVAEWVIWKRQSKLVRAKMA